MIDIKKVGYLGKVHGNHGFIRAYPDEKLEEFFLKANFIFVKINGSKVPYLVEKRKAQNDFFLLKLKGLDSPEELRKLSDNNFYLDGKSLPEKLEESNTQSHLIGYTATIRDNQIIGKLIDFEEHPYQILAVINTQKGNLSIPFHEDLILNIDDSNQTIQFDYDEDVYITLKFN